MFKVDFLDRPFPLEMRGQMVLEFINLHQVNICVNEYSLNFILFLRYAHTIVVGPRARMGKFVSTLSEMVIDECCTTMINSCSIN